MKIYGTTTSDRASKGQGGNKYVQTVYTVEHEDKEREIIATTIVSEVNDSFLVTHIPIRGDSTVYSIPIRKKK